MSSDTIDVEIIRVLRQIPGITHYRDVELPPDIQIYLEEVGQAELLKMLVLIVQRLFYEGRFLKLYKLVGDHNNQ